MVQLHLSANEKIGGTTLVLSAYVERLFSLFNLIHLG